MARIAPISAKNPPSDIKAAFFSHVMEYKGRITNLKATLGHSLLAFRIYTQWYPLYNEVQRILGARLAALYGMAISDGSGSAVCSTYFRKLLVELGEEPEFPQVTPDEQLLLDFGTAVAQSQGQVSDTLFGSLRGKYNTEHLVVLIAFAGQTIATNVFNNVVETDLDDYLIPYLPLSLV